MTPIQNDQHHPIGPRRRTPVRATEPFPLLVMFENDFVFHLFLSKKCLIAIKHDMSMLIMTLAGRCPSSSSLVSATSSPSPLPPTQTPKQPYLGWRSQVQFLRQNDVISLQIMLTPMLLMMTKVLMPPLTGAAGHRSVLSELSGTPARGNHGAAIAEVPQVALSTLAVRTRLILI